MNWVFLPTVKTLPRKQIVSAAALLIIIVWSAGAWAAGPNVITLEDAVVRLMQYGNDVWSAQQENLVSELAVEKGEAVYALKASVSAQPISAVSDAQGGLDWEFGKPLTLAGSVQSPSGLVLTLDAWNSRPAAEGADSPGLALGISLKLWPPADTDTDYQTLLNARETAEIAEREEQSARINAAVEAYRRYRRLQIDEAQANVYARDYQIKTQSYNQTMDKFRKGLASQVDVLTAEVEMKKSKAVYEKALRDFEKEMDAFVRDLGLDPDVKWTLEPLPVQIPLLGVDVPQEEAVSSAWEQSTTLARKMQALVSAERSLKAALKDNGFDVEVNSSVEVVNEHWGSPSYEAVLTFSYDLADGGQRGIRVREAELAYEKAQKEVAEEKDSIREDVLSELSQLQWLWNQVEVARLNLDKAKLEHQARSLQMERGLLDETDLDLSETSLEQSRLDWIKAVIDYEAARLKFISLIGGPVSIEGGEAIATHR